MLTSITLANFRGFSEPIKVVLKPITVLIGKNSAGKSSILKFLQMLRQTVEAGDDAFFITEGRHVQLGTFQDLKNTKTTKRQFFYSLELETEDFPRLPQFRLVKGKPGEVRIIDWDRPKGGEVVEYPEPVKYWVSGRVFYGRRMESGEHSVLVKQGEKKLLKRKIKSLKGSSFLRFPAGAQQTQETLVRFQDEQILNPIRTELRAAKHLSAIREESQRTIQMASPPHGDVGHMGEFAMPHLARLLTDDRDKTRKRLEFINKNLNRILRVGDLLVSREMKGYLSRFRAVNKETGAKAWLADFGFGVSQCLPIFIQGAIMEKGELLMVEQPEAQLHPTAQIELGSYFAQLWTEWGICSIIETHSANLLLRLRKLVKKNAIKYSDLSLAYFYVENRTVRVRNLSINPDGSIEKGLPMEFFGADVIEAMEAAAL